MKNILITGFSRFGDYKSNSTENFLKANSRLGDFYMHSLVFPARTFSGKPHNNLSENDPELFGSNVVNLAKSLQATAIISLGMASDVKGLRIEKYAINWSGGKYCLDFEQCRRLDEHCPPWQNKTTNLQYWNIDLIRQELDKLNIKFEKELSANTGTYCCNALMYRTLAALGPAYKIPYIFLHIPCDAAAVYGLANFDAEKKDLTTPEIIKKILLTVSAAVNI